MDYALRRTRVAERLDELDADALLVMHLPNVRYLSGYTGSNGQVLVARNGSRFFTDGRYEEQSRREVPDMDRVVYGGGTPFAAVLETACRALGAERVAFEAPYVPYKTYEELAKRVSLVGGGDEVGRLRWVKDQAELTAVMRAQEVTDDAFDVVMTKLRDGVSERELALELQWSLYEAGAERPAFDAIVAFGESAAEPHHQPGERRLRSGDIVKLDFGAVWQGYHADMTRTVAWGEPPEELRRIYDVVRRAQRAGIDAVRAGVPGREADAAARGVIEEAGYGRRFGHGLGHGVGLEIHEGPTLAQTFEEALPAGAVVTVEPGVYLPGLGGVRIEDMVVVEDGGSRVLPRTGKELLIL